MPDQRVQMLLERNKSFNTSLSPPALVDVRKKIRGSGAGGLVILSCSDPRVIPEQYFGLNRGGSSDLISGTGIMAFVLLILFVGLSEAAIIRNAGGRASDALRSIATLDAIAGLSTIIVVHHTDCGTTLVLDEEVRELLKKRAPEKSTEIDKMTFGEITDVDKSIREDVALIKAWPFLAKETQVLGFNLDVKTGLLTEVKDDKSSGNL